MFSIKSLLFLLLGLSYPVYSQIGINNYNVVNAVPFNGSNLTNTGTGCRLLGKILECDRTTKLDDGFTGPVDSVFDNLTSFFAFSRQSGQTGVLEFKFLTNPLGSLRVVLHFFNSPSDSIGLPSFSITTGGNTPVPFTFDDNSDLNQNDSRTRNVTLVLSLSQLFLNVLINFENDSRIDWFLTSEVNFFNNSITPTSDPITFEDSSPSVISLGPDTVQSSVNLLCTVVNSGSFEWMWEYKGSPLSTDGRYQIWTADATRTSILEISDFSYADLGNYLCRVRHEGDNMQYNKTIELIISQESTSSSLATQTTTVPVVGSSTTVLSIMSSTTVSLTASSVSSSVSLTASSVSSSISLTASSVSSSISLTASSVSSSISLTASSVSSPATVSVIASSSVSSSTTVSSSVSTVSVTASSSVSSSTTVSSSVSIVSMTASSSDSILPAAIGATFAIAIFLLIAIIVALILILFCSRRKRKMTSDIKAIVDGTELKGSEVSNGTHEKEKESELVYSLVVKEKAPAIPPQNFNPDDVDDVDDKQNVALELEKSSQPKLAKLSKLDNFEMIHNPLFCETVESNPAPNQPQYSLADFPNVENVYAEVKQTSNPEGKSYFDLKNPLYQQASFEYDDAQPFSFVSSDVYSDGPIYSVPEIVDRKVSIAEIGPENLQEVKQLGVGQFGEVVLATTVGLSMKDLGLNTTDDNKEISINVAVKKMKLDDDAEDSSLVSFEKEMKFMSQLKHKNVIQLLAISKDGVEPFMVIEYMENGDLNQFLLGHCIAMSLPPKHGELSLQNLLSMAVQVASGMAYLASHNFIHRDVASRNCLVGENNVVKVADFGLSRSLYDSVYYRVKGKAKMPIRWMATECFYGKFSQFSDVWAYGVAVWEIYTMGREPPYPTLNDEEILEDALKGEHRMLLNKPPVCPKEVYDVLCSSCWATDYRKRATFSKIHRQLVEIEAKLYN